MNSLAIPLHLLWKLLPQVNPVEVIQVRFQQPLVKVSLTPV